MQRRYIILSTVYLNSRLPRETYRLTRSYSTCDISSPLQCLYELRERLCLGQRVCVRFDLVVCHRYIQCSRHTHLPQICILCLVVHPDTDRHLSRQHLEMTYIQVATLYELVGRIYRSVYQQAVWYSVKQLTSLGHRVCPGHICVEPLRKYRVISGHITPPYRS